MKKPLQNNGDPMLFNKRELLTGVSAIAGLSLLPGMRTAFAADEYDLIVVGAGTAGLPCALFAAERGARVLIIERSNRIGGTLDRSSGQIAAAGTKTQQVLGIKDSPDEHFDDIIRISRNTVDRDLARLFVDNAADSIDWLTNKGYQVLPGHPVKRGTHEPYKIRRYQWASNAGYGILDPLARAIEPHLQSGRVRLLIRTEAADLIQDKSGAVRGVVGLDEQGRRTDYRGRHVALTSGGCSANPFMFQQVHGVPLYVRLAYPYNQGGGLMLGMGAGGYLRGGEKYTTLFGMALTDMNIPSPPAPISVNRDPLTRLPWEIYVNTNGERFVQEDNPSIDHREQALLKQPFHRYWMVFDQGTLDKAPPVVDGWDREQLVSAFERYHFFSRADSIEELATWSGIDAAGLAKTVDSYNRAQADGRDRDFGRQHLPMPIRKAPYYAIRMQGAQILTFAGLGVDTDLRVTREDGTPIPNLYAAGEVIGAGATTGNALVNGMMVTPALTFGRLIGQRIEV